MGGSGSGGGGYSGMPVEYWERLKAAQAQDRQTLVKQIDAYLASILNEANARNVELTRKRLEELQRRLQGVAEVEQLLFGGSVAKRTAVEGISDVDALVLLPRSEAKEATPKELLAQFAAELQAKVRDPEFESATPGQMAVTVKFSDGMEIQLLPAVQRGDRLMIGTPDGRGWRETEPKAFREALTAANQKTGGNLVRVVKLFKVINDRLPAPKQLTGYHIEALAIEAAKDYAGSCAPRELLGRFLEVSAQRVLTQMPDVTGQSRHVDASLGPNQSTERRNISQTLEGIKRRLDAAMSLADWRGVLGE